MVDILHRVGIKTSLDKVYQAITSRDCLASWWTADTHGQSEVGATLTFRFRADGADIGGFKMKVLTLIPNTRVQWQVLEGPAEWLDTKIGFDVKHEDGYAIVMFKHEGWREPNEMMHHCSTKWATFLMSLKSLLETGKGAPSPDDVRISNWH